MRPTTLYSPSLCRGRGVPSINVPILFVRLSIVSAVLTSVSGQVSTGDTIVSVANPPDIYSIGSSIILGTFTSPSGVLVPLSLTFTIQGTTSPVAPVGATATAIVLNNTALVANLPQFPPQLIVPSQGGTATPQCVIALTAGGPSITMSYRAITVPRPTVTAQSTTPAPRLWSTGDTHTCIKGQGTGIVTSIRCWGSSSDGELAGASLTTESTFTPPQVPNNEVSQVSAGRSSTCVLYASGHILCWGANTWGQTGRGSTAANVRIDGMTTVPFLVFSDRARSVAVSAGTEHTCVVFEGGGVRCFGRNDAGQLGQDHTQNIGDSWSDMALLPYVKIRQGAAVTDVVAGDQFTCALLVTGRVVCWGVNTNGELGQGTTANVGSGSGVKSVSDLNPIPFSDTAKALQVASWSSTVCAVFASGRVKCWGSGSSGQLGQGSTQSVGDHGGEMQFLDPIAYGTTHHAIMVAVAGRFVCVLFSNGGVRCHGDNTGNVLRIPATSTLANVVTVGTSAGQMARLPFIDTSFAGTPSSPRVVQIGGRAGHVCVVFEPTDYAIGGSVSCWGDNQGGVLGRTSQPQLTSYSNLALVQSGEMSLVVRVPHAPSEVTCTIIDVFNVRLSWGTVLPFIADNTTEFEIVAVQTMQSIARTVDTSHVVTNQAQEYGVRSISASGTSTMSTVMCRPRDFQTCTRSFWRASESVFQSFSCLRNDICPTQVLASCSTGYTGTLCSSCATGYARFRGVCQSCPHTAVSWLLALVSLSAFIGILVVLIRRALSRQPLSATMMLMAIHFLQLLSLIGDLDLQWPGLAGILFQVAKALSMGDLSSYPLFCAIQAKYKTSLVIYWLLPLFFYAIPKLLFRAKANQETKDEIKPSSDDDDNGEMVVHRVTPESKEEASDFYNSKASTVTGILAFVFYPTTFFHFLHIWRCPTVEHPTTGVRTKFLLLDSDVQCWTSSHLNWWVPTSLFFVLYNVIMCAGFIASRATMFRFLKVQYNHGRARFDFVILWAKKFMIIFLVYLSSEVLWQAYVTVWIVFLLLLAIVLLCPYRTPAHQTAAVIAVSAITISLQIGLVFLTIIDRGYNDTDTQPVIFSFAMVVLIFAMAAFLMYSMTRGPPGSLEDEIFVKRRKLKLWGTDASSDSEVKPAEDGQSEKGSTDDGAPAELPPLLAKDKQADSGKRPGTASEASSESTYSYVTDEEDAATGETPADAPAASAVAAAAIAGAAGGTATTSASTTGPGSTPTAFDILSQIFALEDKRILAVQRDRGDPSREKDLQETEDQLKDLRAALSALDEEADRSEIERDEIFAKEHDRLTRHLQKALKDKPDMSEEERARLWAEYEKNLQRLRDARQADIDRQRAALEARLEALRNRSHTIDDNKIAEMSEDHSGDPDYDVDAILREYEEQQRRLREAMELEAARQARELERRLAARKSMIKKVETAGKLVVDSGSELSDDERERLYQEYIASLGRIQDVEDAAAARQADALARKLAARRARKQQVDEDKMSIITDPNIDEETRKRLLEEFEQQQRRLAAAIAAEEARQAQDLLRKLEERKARRSRVESAIKRVESKDLTDAQRDAILNAYNKDLNRLAAVEASAATRQRNALERKLAERRARAAQIDAQRVEVNRSTEVDELARQRILSEYEREQRELHDAMQSEEARQAAALQARLHERRERRERVDTEVEKTLKSSDLSEEERARILAEHKEALRRIADAEASAAARQQDELARRLAENRARRDEIAAHKVAIISDKDLSADQCARLLEEYSAQEKRLADAIAVEEARQAQDLARRLEERKAERLRLEAAREAHTVTPTGSKVKKRTAQSTATDPAERARIVAYYEDSLRKLDEIEEGAAARQQSELDRKLAERRARKSRVDAERVAVIESDSLTDDQRARILQEYANQERDLANAIMVEESRQSADLRRRLEERRAKREKLEAERLAAAKAHDKTAEEESEKLMSQFEADIALLKSTEDAARRKQEDQLQEKIAFHRARKQKLEADKLKVVSSSDYTDGQRQQLLAEYDRQIDLCDRVLADGEMQQKEKLRERISEKQKEREQAEARRLEAISVTSMSEQQRQKLLDDYSKSVRESENATAQAKARQRADLERTIAERKARRAALEAEKAASLADPDHHLDDDRRAELANHYDMAINEAAEDEREAESAQEEALKEQTDHAKEEREELEARKLKIVQTKEIDNAKKDEILQAYDARIHEREAATKASEQRQQQALERKIAERKAKKEQLEREKKAREEAAAMAAAEEKANAEKEKDQMDSELERIAREVLAAEKAQKDLGAKDGSEQRRRDAISLYDTVAKVVRELEAIIDADGELPLRDEHPRSHVTHLPPPPPPSSHSGHHREKSTHEALSHLPKPAQEPEPVAAPAPAPAHSSPAAKSQWSTALTDIQALKRDLARKDLSDKQRAEIQRKYERELARARENEAAAKDRQRQRLQQRIESKKRKGKKGSKSGKPASPRLPAAPPPARPIDPVLLQRREELREKVRKLQKVERSDTMTGDELRKNLDTLEEFAEVHLE